MPQTLADPQEPPKDKSRFPILVLCNLDVSDSSSRQIGGLMQFLQFQLSNFPQNFIK